MRRIKSILLVVFLLCIVTEGVLLAWLVMDTDRINRVEFEKINSHGKEILADLQRYDLKASTINNEFPSVTPANWMQKLEDAVSKASAKLESHSGRPPVRLGTSNTREIRYTLTVTSEELKNFFEVASQIEKMDSTGAVRISSFVIQPRRSETAPLSCVIEVVIYEKAVESSPDETPVPEDLPDLENPVI